MALAKKTKAFMAQRRQKRPDVSQIGSKIESKTECQ